MSEALPKPKKTLGFSLWELDLAFRYLRAKRKDGGVALISIISFFGVMLSVAVLIIVMAVMNGFRDEMMSRLLAFNGHAYVGGMAINDFGHRDDMVKRLEAVPGVTQVSPFVQSPGMAQNVQGVAGLAYIRGVDAKTLKETPIVVENITEGSIKDFGVGDYGGDSILIGDGMARDMGVGPGDELSLLTPGTSTAFGAIPRRKTYTVAGVFKVGVSELDASFVYMPIEQAQLFFDREGEWDALELKVTDPYQIQSIRPQIVGAAGQGGIVQDWTERNASLWGALQVERNVMRLILSLIVAIAAMNIISGLVMLVKNKGKDIAILRTFGADRSSIMKIFFLSGATLGAGGTIAGVMLGVIFCIFIRPIQQLVEFVTQTKVFNPDVYYLSYIPAKIEPTEVAFVVFWSLLAACLSTLPPAIRAARLEPVEALRYE
ncbi:lipoprotein-releasing ABC transporter permease subunit [Asticcacaulis sp. ZE23SCel15]|uniref:lipoprotein-releasing ABC transporter permease subunit n=1 Tax=Asticcacaulis sp. ZE23SCel15 TaxID=3059027 RepID=UPI00266032DE|nr:lipoprotein-releasing ABC transporter permease subunit [Asticcacaulis sp. ZE23SCel15]WKL56788.1 lipoprotein-releasing ABC transporter permease subunit [Asticcacaulis sp. ZE23SCel15]